MRPAYCCRIASDVVALCTREKRESNKLFRVHVRVAYLGQDEAEKNILQLLEEDIKVLGACVCVSCVSVTLSTHPPHPRALQCPCACVSCLDVCVCAACV